MATKPSKKAEILDQQIKTELGIDVRKYRNQEAVDSFVQLLLLPRYVIVWLIRPVLIALAAFILGFFLLDLVHVEYIFYGVFGAPLFLINGLLLGMLLLSWKMKSDILGILNYSLDIMRSAIGDINQVKSRTKTGNRKQVLGLLFKGIIHIVMIPMVSTSLSNSLPFFSGVINRFIRRILTTVANRFSFDTQLLEANTDGSEDESESIDRYLNAIESASTKLDRIVSLAFKVASLPLKIVGTVSFVLLALLLLLIN